MNLLLLGATGQLGQQLLQQALAQGHTVTALVRNPEKITITHPQLTVVKGDATDELIIANAVAGKDAVISSLGVGNSFKANGLIAKAAAVLVPIMQSAQVKRLICVSAFGVGKTFSQANFLQRLFFKLLLKDVYSDKAIGDDIIRNSDLDWTIVHPVKFTNGPLTNRYLAGEVLPMKGMPSISRADGAAFIVKELMDPAYLRKSIVLMTNPK